MSTSRAEVVIEFTALFDQFDGSTSKKVYNKIMTVGKTEAKVQFVR
jgi:hypothetical protein